MATPVVEVIDPEKFASLEEQVKKLEAELASEKAARIAFEKVVGKAFDMLSEGKKVRFKFDESTQES